VIASNTRKAILAIDHGSSKVGLAIASSLEDVAKPLTVVQIAPLSSAST
jgi:RNase H-fold protein (predicted Holliday junction resolvase)